MTINPDASRLKSIANFNGSIQILSMHTSSQSIECIMSLFKDIFNILEFGDGDYGSKDLFLHDLHLFIDVGEDGGLNEVTLFTMSFTANLNFGTLFLAGFDVIHDSGELEFGDLGALDGLFVEWITDDVLLCASSEFLDELVVDIFLDVNTTSSTTALSYNQTNLEIDYRG